MTTALGIAQHCFGRVALLDMDSSLVHHAHHHCHILLKASGPDRLFAVGEQYFPVREDTAVLVNPWQEHHYVHPDRAGRTRFLALYVEPAWLASLGPPLADPQGKIFGGNWLAISADIVRLRDRLAECLAEEEASDIGHLVSELVIAIVHRGYAGAGQRQSKLQDFRIGRAIRELGRERSGRSNLDQLARIAGLSRPRFNQLFRLCTGVSPAVYANALRVEQAVQTLTSQLQPIGVVADRLGFSAQANFTRFFQQHTGVTPSHFRRVARAGERGQRVLVGVPRARNRSRA